MTKNIQLVWPTDSRYVTQYFGQRPEFYGKLGLPGHEGIDLRARMGANLYALADGMVTFAGFPNNHPYGLHIRFRHEQNGVSFESIYAHLEKLLVSKGDRVVAGQLVGLSDNSGNSQGSHLHLTLKITGEQTGKYPAGVVDPWPYLKNALASQVIPANTPPASDLVIYTTVELNMRAAPIDGELLVLLGVSEPLTVLGDADAAKAKLGKEGQWIQVQSQSNIVGYVAAWYVEEKTADAMPSGVIVYPFTKLNVRAGKNLDSAVLGTVDIGDGLITIGSEATIESQIGFKDEWLRIEADSGLRGYVAAEGVHRPGELPPQTGLILYPTDMLSVRAQPSTTGNLLLYVNVSDALEVLGDLESSRLKVGKNGEWLQVKTPTGHSGYVAAWYLQSAIDASFSTPEDQPYLGLFPTTDIPLYALCDPDSVPLATISANSELDVFEANLEAAQAMVGQADGWLFVRVVDTDEQGWVSTANLGIK